MINWANPNADPMKDLENTRIYDVAQSHIKRGDAVQDVALKGNSIEEYKRQFLCEWKPDPRDKALHERLSQYYRETDTNRNAWSEFRHWCFERGYTVVEINRAKRHDNN